MNKITFGIFTIITASVMMMTGCQKDNPVDTDTSSIATEDAARSVAGTVGQDNGGALDQASDVADLAGAQGLSGGADLLVDKYGKLALATTIDTTYDPSTGKWTLSLARTRGTVGGTFYAAITRTYVFQFLNAGGQPQKYWRVIGTNGIDTARSIRFDITGGTGEHHAVGFSQKLNSVHGSWVVTGTNTDTITINGTYSRSAVDTITTRNAVRTLDHTINLALTNVTGPRSSRGNMAARTGGTITGTYSAVATFSRGSLYSDKTINRDFTITLGGGNSTINIGGKVFTGILSSGDLNP
ncbi:MAG: hypothetical protein JWQ98_202 [Chlorobi bacterium]|nr:hypothetical protein [Chlorobiota bacterium]